MKRPLATLLMAVLVLSAWAEPCWACSCIEESKKEQAKRADAVFTGRVVDMWVSDPDGSTTGYDVRVRFDVGKVYKGKVKASQVVRTNSNEASCGFEFQEGKRYSVFARKLNSGKLVTDLCSGTRQGRINHEEYGLPPGEPPD